MIQDKISVERHPFEPFLPEGARMLFLGSFPPQPHRWSMPFYYPNWQNDFWRIMGLIHFADKDHFCIPGEKRFNEALIRRFCADEGLAFYDTACEVRRLKNNGPVPAIGEWMEIAGQAGNDEAPGEDRAPLRFWRMPSSSRAYPLALEKKADYYRQLFLNN